MSTYTTNYNFEKPEGTDFVSPTPFNNNFDFIDSLFKDYSDDIHDINDKIDNHVITDSRVGLITGVGLVYEEFTESGIWVAPSGILDNKIYAIAFGGGGGAGGYQKYSSGSSDNYNLGGGGGGGHMAAGQFTITPGQSYNVVIGAGGNAGKSTSTSSSSGVTSNGSKGGTTTFMSLSAAGGDGGYGFKQGAHGGNGGSGGGGGGLRIQPHYFSDTHNIGNGGNASYGGGGSAHSATRDTSSGDYWYQITGGNGGTYGGGGGVPATTKTSHHNVPGRGGQYGGNGSEEGQVSGAGTDAVATYAMWSLVNKEIASSKTNLQKATGREATEGSGNGGGGFGSVGGKSEHIYAGPGSGGGFFSDGISHNQGKESSWAVTGCGSGGGGFFATVTGLGGGGYFSTKSGERAAGGSDSYGLFGFYSNGGNGVVGIWYILKSLTPDIKLLW